MDKYAVLIHWLFQEYYGPEFVHKSAKPLIRISVPLQGEVNHQTKFQYLDFRSSSNPFRFLHHKGQQLFIAISLLFIAKMFVYQWK